MISGTTMRYGFLMVAIVVFCRVSVSSAESLPADPLAVSIMNFQLGVGAPEGSAEQSVAAVRSVLEGQQNVAIVDDDVSRLFTGKVLPPNETIDSVEAAHIGRMTGAQILLTGRIFAVQNDYVLLGKIMSCETSQIFGEMVTFSKEGSIEQAAGQLGQKIAGTIAGKSALLVRPGEPVELFRQRMIKFIGTAKLPGIVLHAEQDADSAAAVSELQTLLEQLGFKVGAQGQFPSSFTVEVGVGAVSAAAGRRGDIELSRATVTMKAAEQGGGEELFNDQRSVIAAGSVQTAAGARARARATQLLAEQMVLRLVQRGLLRSVREPYTVPKVELAK